MSVIAEMIQQNDLSLEWKRIEILAQCLLDARSGKQPEESLVNQLRDVHHQVEFLRREQAIWQRFNVSGLPDLAMDILASIYAPLVSANVALLFQDLQQSNNYYPGIAFVHRLLAFNDDDYRVAQHLVDCNGELVTRGLISTEGEGPMMVLKPHPSVMSLISGLPEKPLQVPGAVPITIRADWDELILQSPQKRMLHEFLLWINHAEQVITDWGGRSAGGPIALFSGPSGTGKTFAASVIANQLGWDLYRVDLGALVSKYIGETEKNLNALFDAVEGRKILLQFDEVDALMGKRGEIKDARDRYANMEVSHLLSRLEQHQGPCILTTNLSKQIDQAFQRRFHFVVSFPRPEIAERLALWKTLLPRHAPLSESLDLQQVAEAVALSGGEIRNAAMHAAILAASENSSINLENISIGVWRVLQKTEAKARHNQLRQLAQYLPSEIYTNENNCDVTSSGEHT